MQVTPITQSLTESEGEGGQGARLGHLQQLLRPPRASTLAATRLWASTRGMPNSRLRLSASHLSGLGTRGGLPLFSQMSDHGCSLGSPWQPSMPRSYVACSGGGLRWNLARAAQGPRAPMRRFFEPLAPITNLSEQKWVTEKYQHTQTYDGANICHPRARPDQKCGADPAVLTRGRSRPVQRWAHAAPRPRGGSSGRHEEAPVAKTEGYGGAVGSTRASMQTLQCRTGHCWRCWGW